MDSPVIFPVPKIKEENLSVIIDLDEDKTPEDLVYEWDSKVRLKIKNYLIVDNEESLDTLMKWYIQSIKDEVVDFDDFPILKLLIAKHIQFFKLYFVELNSYFVNNYLDNMEEILTFYSNIEVKSFPSKRKDGNKHNFKKSLLSMCQKIVSMLNLYLLNREDRVYHVVMKIKLNSLAEDSRELLNLIYRKLLTEDPSDKSDLGFCRAYILYQKWKSVRKPEDWEKMDAIMYKLYHRTAESVKTNEILSQILLPQNNSVLDVLIHISEKHVIITEEYFKFLKSKKIQEESLILPELSNIEISNEILPNLMNNSEDEDFERAYQNFVKTLPIASQRSSDPLLDDCISVKIEEDNDDDCQIVAVSSVGYESENTELVHEILDDEDELEIIYFKKKEQQNMVQKDKEKSGLSFLDSIEIPDSSDVPREKVSSSSYTTVLPSKPSKNMVTTSTNTSPDPEWNSSTQESVVQIANPIISTSNAQERTKTGVDYQRSSVITSDTNLEIDTECISISSALTNSIDMETSAEGLSISYSVQIKNVVSMQTQTDDLDENVTNSHNSLYNDRTVIESHISENPLERGNSKNCYRYGLITPPSDQPHDEHILTTESNMNPNVYANILRTHNVPDETNNINKILDYLPSSVGADNLEKHTESLPNSCEMNTANDLISSLNEQSCKNVEDQSTLCEDGFNEGSDMELEPNIEPNAKKKHDIFDKDVDSTDIFINQCDSGPGTVEVIKEKNIDNADLSQNASKDVNKNIAFHDHESSFNNENCSARKVVVENIPTALLTSTDSEISCRSPDAYTCSSNPTMFSDSVPLKSSEPSKDSDSFRAPIISANIPCTSTDIVTSQDYVQSDSIPVSNSQTEIKSTSCPDITSTSTDIQDFHENSSVQEGDSEEYIEYPDCNIENGDFKNNENVSQSNLDDEGSEEIFMKDTVANDNGEDLSYIVGDASLSIGAKAHIGLDNHSKEFSVHSDLSDGDNNREGNELLQPEEINQVEKVNEKSIPVPINKLTVAVEKLYVTKNESTENKKLSSSKKNMFTFSEKLSEFTKIHDRSHLRWNKLKETHDLEDCFSGPISKVKGISSSVSPDTNFDLFTSKSSVTTGADSPQTPLNSSANNSGEVISPPYEEIDDFKIYYEENKNSNMLDLSPVQNKLPPIGDKSCNSTTSLGDKGPHNHKDKVKSLQNREVIINNLASVDVNLKDRTLKTKVPAKSKKMRFADNPIDTSNIVSHSPTENTNNTLQSILKKSSSDAEIYRQNDKRMRLRIPQCKMNLKSLAQYNVKPSDPKLQHVPFVKIEKLTDRVISYALNTKKIVTKKKRAQFASQQLTMRADYDKQTTHINKNDMLRINTPEGITTIPIPNTVGLADWSRNAILQSNSSRLEKGMVATTPNTNIHYKNFVEPHLAYKDSYFNSLPNDLQSLELEAFKTLNRRLSISNPFELKSSTPKGNFDDINLNQQPAIVPQVEEFKNTIIGQELGGAHLYPTDYPLTEFALSPFLNSFSPPSISPSLTSLKDPLLIENVPPRFVPEDFESKSHLYNIATCINPRENSCNNVDVSVPYSVHSIPSETSPYNANAELNSYNFENENNTNRVAAVVTDFDNDVKPKDQVPELLNINENVKSEMFTELDIEAETRLPFKKRKLIESSINKSSIDPNESSMDLNESSIDSNESFIDPKVAEEIIKKVRSEGIQKEDISYPAEISEGEIRYPGISKIMVSIAELQESYQRGFKTPAERKEMPPPLAPTYADPSENSKIVTEQYNNHTYNNPTINYHVNNVPCSLHHCHKFSYPILVPNIELTVQQQQQSTSEQASPDHASCDPRARR